MSAALKEISKQTCQNEREITKTQLSLIQSDVGQGTYHSIF